MSELAPAPRHSVRLPVAALGIATIASYGGWFYGFGVLVQPIADDTGWSVATLGAAYAVGQLLSGLGATVGGRVLDRRGARAVFAVGGLIGGALLALAAVAPTPATFAVAFALGGGVVGASGFYHVTMAAARRLRPEEPATTIGPLTIWGAFASPLFLPLTAWLVQAVGWRSTLMVLATTTLVGLQVAAAVVGRAPTAVAPGAHDEDVPLRIAARDAWADPAARKLVWLVAGVGFGHGTILAYQVPVMVGLGLPLATAAALAGGRGLLQLLGRIGLGGVVRRWGTRRPLIAVTVGAIGAAGLLAVSSSVVVGIGYAVVAGAVLGAHSPLAGIHQGEVLPARHLGALMGAIHAIGGAATAAGPLVGGIVADATGSFLPAVGLAGLSFALAALAMATAPEAGVRQVIRWRPDASPTRWFRGSARRPSRPAR